MEYKILEANGVENENIDGAAFNNFTARNQDGVLFGVLNECLSYSPNSTTVIVDTGELIIRGFRVKVTDPYTVQRTASASNIQYQIVGKIILSKDRSVLFSVECRLVSPLTKDPIYTQEQGTYEVEIARFQTGPSGVFDVKKTLKTIGVPQEFTEESLLSMYPVGSIYLSLSETSPAMLFGGTWERISQGRALIGSGSAITENNDKYFGETNYSGFGFVPGATGGQFVRKMRVDELPIQAVRYATNEKADGQAAEINAMADPEKITIPHGDGMWVDGAWYANMYGQTNMQEYSHNMQPYLVVNMWQRVE